MGRLGRRTDILNALNLRQENEKKKRNNIKYGDRNIKFSTFSIRGSRKATYLSVFKKIESYEFEAKESIWYFGVKLMISLYSIKLSKTENRYSQNFH